MQNHKAYKPLTRQDVRRILDKYAESINKAAGKKVISNRHSGLTFGGDGVMAV